MFNKFITTEFELEFINPVDIQLLECDISDPCVHVDLENLPNYSKNYLLQWLIFRGDSLQGVYSLKDATSTVLGYSDNKTVDRLLDPTLDLKWKRLKAERLGYTLKLSEHKLMFLFLMNCAWRKFDENIRWYSHFIFPWTYC